MSKQQEYEDDGYYEEEGWGEDDQGWYDDDGNWYPYYDDDGNEIYYPEEGEEGYDEFWNGTAAVAAEEVGKSEEATKKKKLSGVDEEYGVVGTDRPDFGDDDDAPLSVGKTAEQIIQERMEARLKEQAEKEGADRAAGKFFDPERLGDDFDNSQWVPPTIQRAKDFKFTNTYKGGEAYLNQVSICSEFDQSPAVALYFQFMYSMAWCMFAMTILSIPSLAFAFFGTHIPISQRDSIGLYMLTLGNIGYDKESSTYATDSACLMPANINSTCLHISHYQEITTTNASSILSAMEIIQIIIFLITVVHLHRRTKYLLVTNENLDTSVSDYSVMVTNLPTDTTVEQLAAHFTNVYTLNQKDWRGRPPLEGAKPVENNQNTNHSIFLNTWVADITLHKRLGKFIHKFKSKDSVVSKLRKARARMKMFAEDTPYSKGPNIQKYTKAEQEMIKYGAYLDKMQEDMYKNSYALKKSETGDADVEAGNKKLYFENFIEKMDAPVVAAFVVFQYSESMARCVEDYALFSQFPFSLCYPSRLKFRGYRIGVVKAPEPDELVWENIEASFLLKFFRRSRTAIITLVGIVVSFVIILQASIYKQAYASKIPSFTLCQTALPEMYGRHNISSKALGNVFSTRAPAKTRSLLDKQCNAAIPGTFYATYTYGGDVTRPVSLYDIAACTVAGSVAANYPVEYAGLCPHRGQVVFCPCMSHTSEATCNTYECGNASPTGSPTSMPTNPTSQPSSQPSFQPSRQPTGQPSRQPSGQPSNEPSRQPSSQPTCQPSGQPTHKPSRQPSSQPSRQPSRQPTGQPSRQPSGQPTGEPTGQPLSEPTGQPSGSPTKTPAPSARRRRLDQSNSNCVSFEAKTMGNCFCYSNLEATLTEGGISGITNIQSNVCAEFLIDYSTSSALTYVASFTTVIVNRTLMSLLKYLASFECHTSIDNEDGSLMKKIFLSNYINMAFGALIAYGFVDNMPSILVGLHIFQGPYPDFTAAWYAVVGSYIVITFFVQGITPLLYNYFCYYVFLPFRRFLHYSSIAMQSNTRIIVQKDLNEMEVGPVFDPTLNQAQLLSLVFVAMTFAPGIPILMPLACLIFTLYFRADKRLVLWYYEKAPHMGAGIMKVVLACLPYAALIRLGFACWMFGSPLVLDVKGLSLSSVTGSGSKSVAGVDAGSAAGAVSTDNAAALVQSQTGGQTNAFFLTLVSRATRSNVIPLLVVMLIIIAVMLLLRLLKILPLHRLVYKILQRLCKRKEAKIYAVQETAEGEGEIAATNIAGAVTGWELAQLNHPLRQESAPYTGDYFKYVSDKFAVPNTCCGICKPKQPGLSDAEISKGWELGEQGDRFLIKYRPWDHATTWCGVVRRKGEHKRTYELLDEIGLSSYKLERVPAYTLCMQGLQEGVELQTANISGKGDTVEKKTILGTYAKHKLNKKETKKKQENWNVEVDDEHYLKVAGKKEEKTEAQKNEEMNYGDLNAGGGDSDED